MSAPQVDDVARRALIRLVERSRRHSGLQLPSSFARSAGDLPPPLARMVQGGRGGEVRLKLYLSTVLLAGSSNKHSLYGPNVIFNVSGPSWARSLGLPDPDVGGARRVADAQNWLHNHRFLDVERRPGAEPIVQLLSPDGEGRAWSRPTAPYITVPRGLWTNCWIWLLSATELAVLIALLDLQGGRAGTKENPQPQWMTSGERERYGLSPDAHRRASAALESRRLIVTDEDVLGRDLETPRRRKTYWVDVSRFEDDPFDDSGPAEETASTP